jgi:hypothetical protein
MNAAEAKSLNTMASCKSCDDGLVETVVAVRKCRVNIDDHREHITVETTDGYKYLFIVPEAN